MEKVFWMDRQDQVEVYVKKWCLQNEKPKAIVQLAHGMAEHINRYQTFAEYLLEQNIFVYGNDHRGHGYTGKRQGLLGYFATEEGFKKTTEDLYAVTEQIKSDYPHTPVFLLGHSMGSFLVRNYIQHYSSAINGVILSGTGYFPTLQSKAGKKLSGMLPPRKASKLMNSLAFGRYNKKIKQKNTIFDWLSSDEEAVQSYMDDPHTGFVPTARFFYDLMTGLITMNDGKLNQSIRNDLPLLIVSGDADPVGNYAKGIWKTANLYEKAGLKKITTMLFTDRRHELLNERNKDEVFSAISGWILRHIK